MYLARTFRGKPRFANPYIHLPSPPHERALTNPELQSKLQGVSSAPCSLAHIQLQINRGLHHTSGYEQTSQCSSMSHQNRNDTKSLCANAEQQNAHVNVQQQCGHLNSSNVERRNHIDSCSANFEQKMHSNDFSVSREQRNHASNFCANPEQSTLLNSSSSSCCQPMKHHGRHGEPLYKSLLRPHHCSQSPLIDYVEGSHHLHHHECAFEAENSGISNRFPNPFTDCISCRFESTNLGENNTSRASVSKGQNYFSFRALSNEITLYNWYLIRSSGSHSSEIAVGGFLSSREMDNERIETSTIVKRLEECKVLTKDGHVVNLVGPIDDYRTVSNGFSLQTVHLFISGFPHIWNLVVGMGLPVKGIGTNTASRSCDFYGGEVTSHVSLQKDFQLQGKCVHQSSAPEGRLNKMAACLEVERPLSFEFPAENGARDVEAIIKASDTVVLEELQEQGDILSNGKLQLIGDKLLNDKPRSSGDQLPATVQVHEKQDECINPVGTESDKETGQPRYFVKAKSEHEGSHGHLEWTSKQVDLMGPSCEIENISIESVEAAAVEIKSDDKEPEFVLKQSILESTVEKNQDKNGYVEARADTSKSPDRHDNTGAIETLDEKMELISVQSSQIIDCCRESKISRHSPSSMSRKRKVIFNLRDAVETEHQSLPSLNLEVCTENLRGSCSLNSKGVEHVSSTKIMNGEKSMAKTARQKGKRRKKGKFSLPKYKQSTKLMVKFGSCEHAKDGKGAREVCNEEGSGAGCKRQKSTVRDGNSADRQSGVILSYPSSPSKSAEPKASISALVLEPIMNRRVETRQRVNEKFHVKKAAQKKKIAKKRKECLAKLQHTLKEPVLYKDPNQMEKSDLVIPTIDTQKVEANSKDGLKVDHRRQKIGEADHAIHLCTLKARKAKRSKKVEAGDLDDPTCEKETPERNCSKQLHTEYDSSLSTMASARKRLKQILPPPLPVPLVSVSKQLVSKAFGLKTSRSGRLLVPPLAHWRGQSLVRDVDGGIIAIEDGSEDAPKEGRFTFRPPMEARAKKLQKWLCETASECLAKKLKARKKTSSHKQKCILN